MSAGDHQLARLKACAVVPVVTISETAHAVPLARALADGGLDVIEVTLRTACALDAIAEIARSDVDVLVGAGTILTADDIAAAKDAGASFLVTPATPPRLSQALQTFDGLVIPGVATATEAAARHEEGFAVQKLFPAEPSGGVNLLKSIAGPMPHIQFMPTGGVKPETASAYLDLPNVVAVGGSWVAPSGHMTDGRWADITAIARDAAQHQPSPATAG